MGDIQIRPLTTLSEMRLAADLQRVYWGDDLESVVPAHMLYSIVNAGGHVLAAHDGDRLVGVLIGFLGTNIEEPDRPAMANLQIVSKRMVVLPEYRGQGIGYRLKLAQREIAVRQGIRLVTWTFDPLLAVNAHLNIRKLGAVSTRYWRDYYGTEKMGGLAPLGSSDRLQAEWWVTGRRVDERLGGTRGELGLRQYLEADAPIVNATTTNDRGRVLPGAGGMSRRGAFMLVEIPVDYPAMIEVDPTLAQEWRAHSREVFEHLLLNGYVVTDFLHEMFEGRERAFYLLSQGSRRTFEQVDFSRN